MLARRAGAKLAPDLAALAATLAPRRAAGARVVFTNGCFDLLHPATCATSTPPARWATCWSSG